MAEGITVEYNAFDSVSDKYYYPRGIEYAYKQQEGYRLPVKVVPYDGVRDTILGGANRAPFKKPPDIETVEAGVIRANELGMSFKIALNGGLQIPGKIDLVNDTRFKNDLRALELLAEEGARHGVENIVTIYRDEVLEVVRKLFPNLATSASTIRYAAPRTEEEHEAKYRQDLNDFDQVIPIPQHTIAEFLRRFQYEIGKIVIFPFLTCGQADLGACQAHYRDLYSGLDNRYRPNPNKDCRQCKNGGLFKDEEEFKDVIGLGVSSFKVARNDGNKGLPNSIKQIIDTYLAAKRKKERMTRISS